MFIINKCKVLKRGCQKPALIKSICSQKTEVEREIVPPFAATCPRQEWEFQIAVFAISSSRSLDPHFEPILVQVRVLQC